MSLPGELNASLWRTHCLLVKNLTALHPHGELCCLLVEYLIISSWRSSLSPVADTTIGLLFFFFSPEDLLQRFLSSGLFWRFCRLLDCATFFRLRELCLVATLLGRLLHCCYLCCRRYGRTSILLYFIATYFCDDVPIGISCLCWRYGRTLWPLRLRFRLYSWDSLLSRRTCDANVMVGLFWINRYLIDRISLPTVASLRQSTATSFPVAKVLLSNIVGSKLKP